VIRGARTPPRLVTRALLASFLTIALALVLVMGAGVAPAAQSGRIALDAVASVDAGIGSDVPRSTVGWFDIFAAVRIVDGLDLVARPIVNRRTFDGSWQKQLYELAVRYERPGRVGVRVEAGQMPSPIGLAILENRPDRNPVVSQHSAYYLPVPRAEPLIPRTFLIAAAYPLALQTTVSGGGWDARVAITDSSPVRGRPFFGTNKPPRLLNTVVGFGVKPRTGLRIGGALAHGGYMGRGETLFATTDRDATIVQLEAEWSFGYTRLAGELVRSSIETTVADGVAAGGWMELTQTLTPRIFLAGRADAQQFRYQRLSRDFVRERYDRYEAILGVRVTPDITLRGGYMVRNGYVVSHWDDHLMLSIVWQRRIL
jgi:hypothetical protein